MLWTQKHGNALCALCAWNIDTIKAGINDSRFEAVEPQVLRISACSRCLRAQAERVFLDVVEILQVDCVDVAADASLGRYA